jgi:hypothetical protein
MQDTAHLWELSGGPRLSKALADGKHAFLPLTALPTSVVVIVLDLSNVSLKRSRCSRLIEGPNWVAVT